MLFMVIEQFRGGDARSVGDRFQRQGRMLPHGVAYLASWVDRAGTRCYQVLEAPDLESLNAWVGAWNDLIDFEIVPVMTSAEFWARRPSD